MAVAAAVQREVIGEVVAGERWLLDSAYGDWLDLVLPRTQLVVGLDYPRWAVSDDGPEVRLFTRPRELEAWVRSLGP
ncbi:hypothetical protein GCM10023339_20900 [Alloalcanivorax gelatiniphagus]